MRASGAATHGPPPHKIKPGIAICLCLIMWRKFLRSSVARQHRESSSVRCEFVIGDYSREPPRVAGPGLACHPTLSCERVVTIVFGARVPRNFARLICRARPAERYMNVESSAPRSQCLRRTSMAIVVLTPPRAITCRALISDVRGRRRHERRCPFHESTPGIAEGSHFCCPSLACGDPVAAKPPSCICICVRRSWSCHRGSPAVRARRVSESSGQGVASVAWDISSGRRWTISAVARSGCTLRLARWRVREFSDAGAGMRTSQGPGT